MQKLERRHFEPSDYDFYVKEYISKSEENGKPITHSCLRKEPFCLPDARWYIKYCPDENVKTWADFVNWCGFIVKGKSPSKEKTTELIFKMQSKINRPLVYDDFRGNGCYHVPIILIKKYWGTVNKMKKELGLKIVQESMIDKHLSKDKFDCMILDICNFVHSENRNFITTKEIDDHTEWVNANTLQKMSRIYYNCKLQDLLGKHNISIGKQGSGINFNFNDGEHASSQFEYMFSKYLKEYGLKYNVDYFRDVKYSSFIQDCNNNMNCDYVINVNGKIIYIEIAGILAEYKEWYYDNKTIERRKSRERYRNKLMKKEEMLKSHNLTYFILFPCDLTKDNVKNILEDGSLELKRRIESFNQHNIDWAKIRNTNEELTRSLDFKKYMRYQKAV